METHLSFDTPCGVIVAVVYPIRAPKSAGNFLRYVDEHRYEGATFYRTVRPDNEIRPLQLIQGGLGPEYEDNPPLPPIEHESTAITGLTHRDGALSMARWAPGTAASEFFIVIGDTPELDCGGSLGRDGQGFAVFGQVVDGMEIIRGINAGRVGTTSPFKFMIQQVLLAPVHIRISRCAGG